MPRFNRRTFLEAYQRGRRDFRGVRLQYIELGQHRELEKLNIPDCDFSDAELLNCWFVGSDLRRSNFTNAQLWDSNFARADLSNSLFAGADLTWCNLNLADCFGIDFTSAVFSAASLWNTNLAGTILTGADLSGARLKGVALSGAIAKRLILGDTVLTDLDLSIFATARFRKPELSCDIDWSAVAQSLWLPEGVLKSFLVKVGMPDSIAMWLIEAARALDPRSLFSLMQSTFISYGSPDEAFAMMLRDELQRNGVSTFLFRDNAPPGEKLHRVMREGINAYDRVILVCSRASLNRPGVLNEIEETLQREARDGGASYLIPVRLDNYVFSGWNPPNTGLAAAVRARVVGDFRQAKRSRTALSKAITPLLRVLRRATPPAIK